MLHAPHRVCATFNFELSTLNCIYMSALLSIFTNAAFLPGLLAAGLPVLIHLLARQRAREIYFPTLRFLRLTAERTSRRRHLEEIVLLLLRTLAVAMVALALSGPVISTGAGIFGRGALSAVIVVDNSLSVNQDAAGRPAIDRIREAAADILADLPAGSRWALWLACGQDAADPLRRIQARPTSIRKSAVNRLHPTAAGANLLQLLEPAIKALRKEKTGTRELYILSDGQAANWTKLPQVISKMGRKPRVSVFVYTAAGTGKPNITVKSVSVSARAPLPGEELKIEADLHAFGRRASNTTLTLYLGGALAQRQKVSLPADGSSRVVFNAPLGKPGWVDGLLQIDADACTRDNRAFFTLEVRRAVRVLIVDADISPIDHDRASYYLAAALAPLGTAAIQPRRISPAQLIREGLSAIDAVFMINVPAPSREAIERLKAYVRRGGTLVLMPGSQVDHEKWNLLLGAQTDTRGGLLPADLGAPRSFTSLPAGSLNLEPGDAGHPLTAVFAAIARPALRRVKITRAFTLKSMERSPARMAVALGDGTPFIMSKAYGIGRVVLWAALPAPAWGTIQTRPIFVPLVHAHAFLGLGLNRIGSVRAGTPLVLAAPESSRDFNLLVQRPDRGEEKISGKNISRDRPLLYANTWDEGIYRVARAGAAPARRRWRLMAVSPAGDEGNLSLAEPSFLQTNLSRLGHATCANSLTELADARNESRKGIELMYPLLVLAMLLLLAEAVYGAGRVRNAKL